MSNSYGSSCQANEYLTLYGVDLQLICVAKTTRDTVRSTAWPYRDRVVSIAALDDVVTRAAIEKVDALVASHGVVPSVGPNYVISGATLDHHVLEQDEIVRKEHRRRTHSALDCFHTTELRGTNRVLISKTSLKSPKHESGKVSACPIPRTTSRSRGTGRSPRPTHRCMD